MTESAAILAERLRLPTAIRLALILLAPILLTPIASGAPAPQAASSSRLPLHTFYLEGGYFYGPGPIVPDTRLPSGRLANIRFDAKRFQGFCEFANDGTEASLLSDRRTRINQNIDAGRLLIGGGTSPVLLTAVDGGPHHGTEQYYLDEQYRFVWRVDIALDPGFAEGIIRLDDFVLTTGVVRIGRSLQSERGQPGGYDQAGSLAAGEYLAGRLGDFDQDNYLDGVLVAAPHVPLAADMLPGAPVGNRRGFRTDVPIAPQLSAELMLRGAMHLREPLDTAFEEGSMRSAAALMRDLEERIRLATARANAAAAGGAWLQSAAGAPVQRLLGQLERLRADVAAELGLLEAAAAQPSSSALGQKGASRMHDRFSRLEALVAQIASINARSGHSLPEPAAQVAAGDAGAEPAQKSY